MKRLEAAFTFGGEVELENKVCAHRSRWMVIANSSCLADRSGSFL
jgi:hypothetical protein